MYKMKTAIIANGIPILIGCILGCFWSEITVLF